MTLTEFAQRAGYSLNHCCQIELGNSNGSPKYQRAAAQLLDCKIEDITDGEPLQKSGAIEGRGAA